MENGNTLLLPMIAGLDMIYNALDRRGRHESLPQVSTDIPDGTDGQD
jgi:hypothetical protein